MHNFYAVIIGTEILNNRREDKHFKFIQELLGSYGHTLFASFIIKDDKTLIKNTFELIKKDPKGVLFSFGGIGSTPDDLTREIAAEVFTCKPLVRHKKFEKDIIERFGDEAYPHRVHMAEIPENANLIKNPVNNMSGFELEHRYFFVPGFPEMSHPMLQACVKEYFSTSVESYRKTLLADTSENTLIGLMQELTEGIELSSLPMINNGKPKVELSLSGKDNAILSSEFEKFTAFLNERSISFTIKE